MTMRTKITSGFIAVIAVFLLAVILSVFSLLEASDGFTRYRTLARHSNLAGELQANMLMVRMNVKDFIIQGDETKYRAYQEYFSEMERDMAEAKTELTEPDRQAQIQEADTRVTSYGQAFTRLHDEVISIEELLDTYLDVIGPSAEGNLTEILSTAEADGDMDAAYEASMALRALLLGRLYVIKYVEDSSVESYADRVRSELATTEEYLESMDVLLEDPRRRQLLSLASDLVSEYSGYFEQIHQALQNRDDLRDNQLDVLGPEIADDVDEVKLSLISEQDELGPRLQANNQRTMIMVIILSAAAVIIGIIIALYTTVSILRQLGADPAVIDKIMNTIAKGDLDIEHTSKRSPEGVYLSVLQMVESLKYKADRIEQFAAGDFSIEIELESERDSLGSSLQKMKASLNELLSKVNIAVSQVSTGSDQVSESSQALSQGATEQASSLEEISASLNEINTQAQQNADNAKEANGIASQASESAGEGSGRMEQLVQAMADINNSSEQIRQVVKVIDDIAFQINLLALNANVEAARAGKYGKGFGVVAEEVRNLATRSAEAVKETTEMVDSSISSIERGNTAAEETADQLSKIVEGVNKVTAFLGEIATASNEQALGIDQISEGLDQIGEVTQSNTASAEESAAAAEELASQSNELKAMIAMFKLEQSQQPRLIEAGAGKTFRAGASSQSRNSAAGSTRAASPKNGSSTASQPSSSTNGNYTGGKNRQTAKGASTPDWGTPGRSGGSGQPPKSGQSSKGGHAPAGGGYRPDTSGSNDISPEEIIRLNDDEFEDF